MSFAVFVEELRRGVAWFFWRVVLRTAAVAVAWYGDGDAVFRKHEEKYAVNLREKK